jgi:hypothetical protein
MENNSAFNEILTAFIANSQDKVNEDFKKYPNCTVPTLVTMQGKKFVRIVRQEVVSRSAWAFVDISNGDILKAASWATPAKHARANIYKPETWVNVSSYGPAYLR